MNKIITSVVVFYMLLLVPFVANAQEKINVLGTVTSSEDGLPMPGVSVVVVGSSNGTTTDFNGNFNIEAEVGSSLQFSFMGYANKEVEVSENRIEIELEPGSASLNEVIVIGYGTSTKQAFTGSAVTIDAKKLESKRTTNITQALAGETAGVTVINTSGQPGTTSKVRIRGYGSVNGSRSPLYVVDGVPFDGNINSINPADIASTTILKDASATAIYGARGANGVILITTKKGKSGASRIDVDFNYGVNVRQLPRYERITNQEEYMEIGWDGLKNFAIESNKFDYYNKEEMEAAVAFASANLFNPEYGIAPHYNMWNKPGKDLIDPATGKFRSGVSRKYTPSSWEDVLFNNGERKEANIRLSGGVGKNTYSTSFGMLNDKGYYLNSDYKRYTSRVDIGHQVKKWLKGTMNVGYTYSETNQLGQAGNSSNGFWFADNIPTIYPIYLTDSTGTVVKDKLLGGNRFDYGDNQEEYKNQRRFGALTNAAGDMTYDKNKSQIHEINGNSYLEATFLRDFKAFSRFGLQYSSVNGQRLSNPFYGGSATQGGSISRGYNFFFTINFLQGLSYEKEFDLHKVNVSLFHETNSYTHSSSSASKSNLVDPYGLEFNNAVVNQYIGSYTNDAFIESYFGKLDYNYDSKYYGSVTVRRDGSSRFKNNKWGTFYSGGLGWIASKESFLENVDVLKFLKFKTSYGVVGDQAGASLYSGYDLYSISNLDDNPSLAFSVKGNPDLTWETSKMFQFGTEMTIGKYLDAEFDYYVKNTDNLFFNRRVGPSVGYALIKVNDGALRNSGLEFNLTGHAVNTNDFKLDLVLNGEIINNEIIKMPIDPTTGKEKIIDGNLSVGHSLYDHYMREYTGVDPETGTSRWKLQYDDKNNNGKLDKDESIANFVDYIAKNPKANVRDTITSVYANATQNYVGKSAIPDVRGAFRIEASYKGFDVSVQFLYQLGGYAVDYAYSNLMANRELGNNIWHVDIRDRWKKPGDITDVPRLNGGADNNTNSTSTRFLVSTDYLSMNNIRLGYNFSERITNKLGIKQLSIFVTGDNLWLFSARDGYNPMTSENGSSSTYVYQPLTTYSGGVKMSF